MTDYGKRSKMLASGLPRIVVRKSTRYVMVQVISPKASGDVAHAYATSKELNRYNWAGGLKNTPAAYLTGLLAGLRAKNKGIERAIPDIGLSPPVPSSRVFAALKGAADAGLEVSGDPRVYPPEERIKGQHIQEYLKAKRERMQESDQAAPLSLSRVVDIPSRFEEVRNRIVSEVGKAG